MKLVGFLQVYNELEKGNIYRCLESMSKYCDDIAIYDDGSTDGTLDVCKEYTDLIIGGQNNDFRSELFHKQKLLELALSVNPDWIFWLDADEIVEAKGERGGIRNLCENAGDFDSFAFHEINLWRCENYYRVDNQYNAGIFCRLWKNNGELKMNTVHGLHHRQSPMGLKRESFAKLEILHYGFSSDENIINKYKTYKTHGQTGWALNRLIDERTLMVRKSKKEWFNHKIEEKSRNEVYKSPVVSKL